MAALSMWRHHFSSSSSEEPPNGNLKDARPTDFTGRKVFQWERTHHNFPDFIDKWGRKPFFMTGALHV